MANLKEGIEGLIKETNEEKSESTFNPKDYGNVRVYPNETGNNMDKNNKWIGEHYSVSNAHKIDDEYLKNHLVGKTKNGADIYQLPDGYFSGNPRITQYSFKTIDDLNAHEKEYSDFHKNPENFNKNFNDYYMEKLRNPNNESNNGEFKEVKEPVQPFKLDSKKYPEAKATDYGFIYNVGNSSITDVGAQNKSFGKKNDPYKNYGFTLTVGGDEVYYDTFEDAYNDAIKANKNNNSYPRGTSEEYTKKVNEEYEKALAELKKLGYTDEQLSPENIGATIGDHLQKWGYSHSDEEKRIYELLNAIDDKHYNDDFIKKAPYGY